MNQVPITAYQETLGMLYFARMLDKMRKFAAGQLREDFHRNLGKGMDAWCCEFLQVDYEALKSRVLAGGTDEEHLTWCQEQGRTLTENGLFIWNSFLAKVGWNDRISPILEKRKAEGGLQDRDEIQTMAEYFEYDEGRKS